MGYRVTKALTGRQALVLAAWLLLVGLLLTGCRRPPDPVAEANETASRIVIETRAKASQAVADGQRAAAQTRMIEGATEQEVGIAFYPGAHVVTSQLVRTNADLTAGAELVSKDNYQDILDFYRERYASPELKVVEQAQPTGKMILLNWRDPQGNYTIGLRRDDADKQTVITLARIKSARKHPRSTKP